MKKIERSDVRADGELAIAEWNEILKRERLTTFAWPERFEWVNIEAGFDPADAEADWIRQAALVEKPERCGKCESVGRFVQMPILSTIFENIAKRRPGLMWRTAVYHRCAEHLIEDFPILFIFRGDVRPEDPSPFEIEQAQSQSWRSRPSML